MKVKCFKNPIPGYRVYCTTDEEICYIHDGENKRWFSRVNKVDDTENHPLWSDKKITKIEYNHILKEIYIYVHFTHGNWMAELARIHKTPQVSILAIQKRI